MSNVGFLISEISYGINNKMKHFISLSFMECYFVVCNRSNSNSCDSPGIMLRANQFALLIHYSNKSISPNKTYIFFQALKKHRIVDLD